MTVAVVRRLVKDDQPAGHHLLTWCPGCDLLHRVQFVGEDGVVPEGPVWTFDGNVESPTVQPSILVKRTYGPDHEKVEQVCHSYLTAGVWQFLDDCTHALKGQHVPLPPLPEWVTRKRS